MLGQKSLDFGFFGRFGLDLGGDLIGFDFSCLLDHVNRSLVPNLIYSSTDDLHKPWK